MSANHPTSGFTLNLCGDYETAARAATELLRHSTVILDCEGLNLGMPDGALSIIAISNPTASQIFLFDVLALTNKTHPQLSPLFSLLRNADITKLVWDGRSQFFEIADEYGVLMEGVLDLQVVEVVQCQEWREGYTMNYFERIKDEIYEDPSSLDDIHRLFGLEHADVVSELFQVLDGSWGKDAIVKTMHRESGGVMWMRRPLPPVLLNYPAHDLRLIALLYARFRKGGHLKNMEDLKDKSARFMKVYPTRELKALHTPLDLTRFMPLDVMTAPPANALLYPCARCGWMLSLSCFSVWTPIEQHTDSGYYETDLQRLSMCRLCHLLARRNSEALSGKWVSV